MPRKVQIPDMLKQEDETMAAKKAKKKTFSAVKAVKANARERVGQPKAERVIVDTPRAERRKAKHKPTLAEILVRED
ncbi:hypothetical protein GCM10011586_35040 [Silvibacterium dinghuense]|nr:hypothetical protein GCM10011586_35040 [Silvibacterium dinghuense]